MTLKWDEMVSVEELDKADDEIARLRNALADAAYGLLLDDNELRLQAFARAQAALAETWSD